MIKKSLLFITLFILITVLTSCEIADLFYIETSTSKNNSISEDIDKNFSKFDKNTEYDMDSLKFITITNERISTTGDGINVSNNTITIKDSGDYMITGNSDNARIIVDSKKTDKIHLIFNDLNLSSQSSSALYIISADKTVITLLAGSNNTLSDAQEYTYSLGENEHFSTIYSNSDLIINGSGKLTITGNRKNGITTKKRFKMLSSTLEINAKYNGIKAEDSLVVASGNIKINAENDGLKASNNSNGYIIIFGGIFNISAKDDALQADDEIIVKAGEITAKVVNGLQIKSLKQKIAIGTIKNNA